MILSLYTYKAFCFFLWILPSASLQSSFPFNSVMLLWEKKNPGIFLGFNVKHLWPQWSSSPNWQLPASAAAFYWRRQPCELVWAELFIMYLHHKLWKFPFQCSVTWVFFEKENRQWCLVVEVKPDEAELLWGCYVSLCMSVTKKTEPKFSRTLNSCPFLIGTCKYFFVWSTELQILQFFLDKIHLLHACVLKFHTFQLVRWAQQ